ncbi:MAG: hypothetical protein M5U34_45280 [Chloroflexi bacterium]|nr:hypothetical protein [Chloroflexota bacterium]
MNKQAFLSWQTDVRAELVRLEQQQTNDRAAQQEMELDTGQARARAKGQEVGLG